MVTIRVTFKDGKRYFVKENRKSMVMVDNIKDAFQYRTTLEFKVSFKLMKIMDEPYYNDKGKWRKDDVVGFELVDPFTLEAKPFNIKDREIEIKDTIYVDPTTFRRLMKCGKTSSHWVYDKDDNWIGFPKETDYKKITKIRYYERGLTHTMTSHNNWNDRYDEHSWHGCYELHHKCMLNPIIQQICLMDLDCCHEFTIYEKKLN